MIKTGLLFGSFNPIHIGHLIIANTVLEGTDLDEVWFVVSPLNPFKSSATLLHHFDRYEMVKRAIDDNVRFRVSDIEFSLPQPSYTIDTLVYLKEKNPGHDFSLIMGEDNLAQLPRWKNYQQILENFFIYYYARPNVTVSSLGTHPKIKQVEAPLLDISATFIRKCIKEGKSIRYLVPQEVEDYLRVKKFFL